MFWSSFEIVIAIVGGSICAIAAIFDIIVAVLAFIRWLKRRRRRPDEFDY